MALGFLEFWAAGLPRARASESGTMAASRMCSAVVTVWRSEQFLKIMSHRHVRLWVNGGQERARNNRCLARATILHEKQGMNSGLTVRRFHLARASAWGLLPRLLIYFLLPLILLGQDPTAQKGQHPTQADEVYAKGMSALQQGDLATAQAA